MNNIQFDNKNTEVIGFSDIFDLSEIQHLQDLFSDATGVASIITSPDGIPITQPSNFCRFCRDLVLNTEKGRAKCYEAFALPELRDSSDSVIMPCAGGGLLYSGTRILVGDRHIANLVIGQVRIQNSDKEKMLQFAGEIGVNHNELKNALAEVPVMPLEQFSKITQLLSAFSNQLSEKAYANYRLKKQDARQKKAEDELRKSEEKYRLIAENTSDTIAVLDLNLNFIYVSPSVEKLLGYTQEEFLFLKIDQVLTRANA